MVARIDQVTPDNFLQVLDGPVDSFTNIPEWSIDSAGGNSRGNKAVFPLHHVN